MIVIIDSGGANLSSIISAFERLEKKVLVSNSIEDIQSASHLILPGVGEAKTVMSRLNALGLVKVLQATTKPVLGICVGMHVLFEYSEEGETTCLGVMPGAVKKLSKVDTLCLPHMGWNTIKFSDPSRLLQDIAQDTYFYYVHNFALPRTSQTVAYTEYGTTFSAVVARGNFVGVQFHPERSGVVGAQLLKNFVEQAL